MKKLVSIRWDSLEIIVHGHPKKGGYDYPIDLERCTTPAQVLDWIVQVSEKPWCDGELLVALIEAIDEACHERLKINFQGAFCPMGMPMRVDWTQGTTRKIIEA